MGREIESIQSKGDNLKNVPSHGGVVYVHSVIVSACHRGDWSDGP
jgi:hypothetical protein